MKRSETFHFTFRLIILESFYKSIYISGLIRECLLCCIQEKHQGISFFLSAPNLSRIRSRSSIIFPCRAPSPFFLEIFPHYLPLHLSQKGVARVTAMKCRNLSSSSESLESSTILSLYLFSTIESGSMLLS